MFYYSQDFCELLPKQEGLHLHALDVHAEVQLGEGDWVHECGQGVSRLDEKHS